MQSKGAIRLVVILFVLACLYQLSFTWANYHQENKAAKEAAAAVEQAKLTAEYANVPENEKAYYLDSIGKERQRFYTDSITPEVVYLGNTFKEVKEKNINLGLDLKGGMNVMLQVQLQDLVKALSDYNQTPEFLAALDAAKEKSIDSRDDYITLFAESWKECSNGKRLASIFGTIDMKDKIQPSTTDEQVIQVLRDESESAIANSFNVLRNRIDRFGVTQPNIQRLGNTGRILVELPGVKEPERVRKLLQGTASLEFWPTFENQEIFPYLQQANIALRDYLAELSDNVPADSAAVAEPAVAADSTASDDILAQAIAADSTSDASLEQFRKESPLFAVLNPMYYQGQIAPGACIGMAHYKDTAKINQYFELPVIKQIFPAEFVPMWTVKASDRDQSGIYFELVAIKKGTRDGKAPLDGGVVTDASVAYGNTGASPMVDMAMNAEGSRIWARLTADNLGKQIAVVLDGMVYSYPTVQSEITGGRSQITGHFTIEEATDLANVLKSGKLPAPATIVQEQVVGPSLGQESINAGMTSFVLAFLLVLIYMVLFYSGAGMAACVALLCNAVLLMGSLAGFGAVLTLPGIAGLVLTMGMAVDANVIIYERVKEELRAGKQLRLAIHDGYRNAYSAIIDGNLTTIIVGIILMAFGSGPVKGFATTLVIGIITSMFTSIFVTRLIFESRLSRNKNITFDNKFSRDFLQHTHINFIGLRKYAYIISAVLIVIAIASMTFKGFSYGVDLSGGRTYVLRFDKNVTPEQVRAAANEAFGETVEVKQFGGGSQMKLTTKYKIEDESKEVDQEVEGLLYNALKGLYAEDMSLSDFTSTLDNPNGIISSDKVGPTIANDMKRDAVVAVFLALLGIFIYITIRFKYWTWASGGIIALAHDSIIVIGFFSLFSGILPFSLDVDQTFIAAVLTIIGYSINDTVVIMDRIREYKKLYPKRDLKTNANDALNSTLARTFNTSASTLVVMIAIAIFGGEVIRGFAVALTLGIVIGTYSSVFVATPLMYDFTTKIDEKRKAKQLSK